MCPWQTSAMTQVSLRPSSTPRFVDSTPRTPGGVTYSRLLLKQKPGLLGPEQFTASHSGALQPLSQADAVTGPQVEPAELGQCKGAVWATADHSFRTLCQGGLQEAGVEADGAQALGTSTLREDPQGLGQLAEVTVEKLDREKLRRKDGA